MVPLACFVFRLLSSPPFSFFSVFRSQEMSLFYLGGWLLISIFEKLIASDLSCPWIDAVIDCQGQHMKFQNKVWAVEIVYFFNIQQNATAVDFPVSCPLCSFCVTVTCLLMIIFLDSQQLVSFCLLYGLLHLRHCFYKIHTLVLHMHGVDCIIVN